MARIVAVASCPTGIAHTFMAAEGVKRGAEKAGHQIKVETQGSAGGQNVLSAADINAADVVIIAADTGVDRSRFANKPIYETSTRTAIHDGEGVVRAALDQAGVGLISREVGGSNGGTQTIHSGAHVVTAPASNGGMQAITTHAPTSNGDALAAVPATIQRAANIVAITSCPTGIAHTFMAAEGVQKGAEKLGHQVKVETQGSVGAQNVLTDDEIAAADVVIIAADTKIDKSRFAGKPIYETSTNAAINDGAGVVQTALAQASAAPAQAQPTDYVASVQQRKAAQSARRTGPYKHLMTGVSYMLPLVVAGGLSIALAFAFGGILPAGQEYPLGTVARAFNDIGSTAFSVFVGILAAFIAYSIADRPGIAPGLVGGLLASTLGAGFLGGIVAGFLAGYVTKFLADNLRLPSVLAGLMPVLILPFIGTVVVGLAMVYVIGPPVAAALSALTGWLQSLGTGNAIVLGLILGAMMAFDMGGPVNKAAYAFALGIIGQVNTPIAAVMAAGMTPPLGLALAAFLFKNRFDDEERKAAGPAVALGLAFITEGAIPFAAKDPLRVIPSLMIGSATAGALSMYFNIGSRAPHGGVFVFFIPNAITNVVLYTVAILVGTVVTALALFLLKRPVKPAVATEPAPPAATGRAVNA